MATGIGHVRGRPGRRPEGIELVPECKPYNRNVLTIGRLGRLPGLEAKTLRYYDRVGLVRPAARTPAGYRLYAADAVDRVGFILRAKALRISLPDIRRMLAFRGGSAQACQHVLDLVEHELAALEAQAGQLELLHRDLRRIHREVNASLSSRKSTSRDCHCSEIISFFRKTARQKQRS